MKSSAKWWASRPFNRIKWLRSAKSVFCTEHMVLLQLLYICDDWEELVSQLCKYGRTMNLLLWFMSPGMVFDHRGLSPPGTVATRHDHFRWKHFAAEVVYFVVMIHDDNDRYRRPAAWRGIRTTFIAGQYRKSWVNIDVSHVHRILSIL